MICTGISYAIANPPKQPPLTDPILKVIDGLPGVFDKTKAHKTFWLVQEIKNIHEGRIKLNKQGQPDPHAGRSTDLIFAGKKHTIKSLIALEGKQATFSPKEKQEFNELFVQVKKYFAYINNIMIADARGAQQFMVKLIQEYCKKNNRPNSLLLQWNEESNENEMFERDVTNFSIFYVFSTDLQNFLAALIVSCPKAFAQMKEEIASQKKGS
jgi:ribosome-binding ATPase YchF (GTP1/OBG family)